MSKLAGNIHSQPESLGRVLDHQRGAGAHALAQAAELLKSGRRVLITGMGASLFASIPLQYRLSSIGIPLVAHEAGELLHYQLAQARDAVVLVVSRSGESVEIARLLQLLKGVATIIGITNVPQSRLALTADVSIHLSSLEDEIVAIQTYTGTLLALYLLGSVVAGSLDAAGKEVQQLLPAFRALVEDSMSSLTQWDAFLPTGAPVYLLARGASLSSAQEGALLFHEVAKSPAVAMAAASFRHGPVEVVDVSFRALIFAPQDQTRSINLSLAHDIEQFGGRVRIVGAPPADAHDASWCAAPSVPQWLAPIFEIVPVQAAALRHAQLRNIPPGSFRYAPQVAVDEASFHRPEKSR